MQSTELRQEALRLITLYHVLLLKAKFLLFIRRGIVIGTTALLLYKLSGRLLLVPCALTFVIDLLLLLLYLIEECLDGTQVVSCHLLLLLLIYLTLSR